MLKNILPFCRYDYSGEKLDCNLCGSSRTILLSEYDRAIKHLTTLMCADCGLQRHDPLPTEPELANYYRDTYRFHYQVARSDTPPAFHLNRSGKLAKRRYEKYKSVLTENARVLDFGAGSGEFLKVCREHGCQTVGFEPGAAYSRFAREEYGLDVRTATWLDVDLPKGGFDIVASFHVFEHLRDPKAAMKWAAERLAPDGVFIIEVPNMAPNAQSCFQRFHFAHVHGFLNHSLVAMGASVGLVPKEGFNADGTEVVFRLARPEDTLASAHAPELSAQIASRYDRTHPLRELVTFGWVRDGVRRISRDLRDGRARPTK